VYPPIGRRPPEEAQDRLQQLAGILGGGREQPPVEVCEAWRQDVTSRARRRQVLEHGLHPARLRERQNR
jgi:hypothetical protein